MKRRIVVATAAAVAAVGLAGCGEKPQVAEYKQGKYQGKPDSKPWDNDPAKQVYTRSAWTPGDRTSWETALKQRAVNQNEYARTQKGG